MDHPAFVRLARRVMTAIGRGKITLVDDTGVVQRHQIDIGPQGPGGSLALRDKTPALAFFGFSSNPPAKSDAVVLFVGGDRSNGVIIASNHQQYRLKNLNPGEAAIHDQWGNIVKLTAAGIVITHTAQVTVTAPKVVVMSNDVELGATGGAAVARVGDTVNLSTGLITSGSAKVKAA